MTGAREVAGEVVIVLPGRVEKHVETAAHQPGVSPADDGKAGVRGAGAAVRQPALVSQ